VLTRRESAATNGILSMMVLFALAPVVGVVLVALQAKGVGGGITSLTDLTLGNFGRAWDQGMMSASLRSSTIVVSLAVPAATGLSVLAGYAFATMRWPGRGLLLGLFVFGLMIPIEGTLIPLYFMWRQVGITDTYWAIILTEIGYHMPFGVFWMAQSFRAVPRELIESARIDGASTWQILRRVVGPVCMPAISTLVALQFMWVWNNFLMPLVMISSQDKQTATVSLSFFQGEYVTDFTALAAASVIVALPVVVAYVVLQRQFIAGFASGALKG
jgi:raffinose/stachyose/melibiose transport system permease protein